MLTSVQWRTLISDTTVIAMQIVQMSLGVLSATALLGTEEVGPTALVRDAIGLYHNASNVVFIQSLRY